MSDEETAASNPPSAIQNPPQYEETAPNTQPVIATPQDVERQAPPPSYESLFGRLKSARAKSTSNAGFAKVAVNICCGSVVAIVCIAVMLALPVAEMAIGGTYFHDCPAQRLIPIYLIVAGVFGTVKGLGLIAQSIKSKVKDEDEDAEEKSATNPFDTIFNVFLFAWFICGNVWVYGLKGEWVSSPSTAGNFCDPTLYYFAFWVVTLTYILLGVFCLAGCIFIIVACCLFMKGDD